MSYDIALSADPSALSSLLELGGADHVLVGSDCPFAPEPATRMTVEGAHAYPLGDADRARVERGTALDLLPSWPGACRTGPAHDLPGSFHPPTAPHVRTRSPMYRLLNVDGRAALEVEGHWFDLAGVSGDPTLADPMAAVARTGELHDLSERCAGSAKAGHRR